MECWCWLNLSHGISAMLSVYCFILYLVNTSMFPFCNLDNLTSFSHLEVVCHGSELGRNKDALLLAALPWSGGTLAHNEFSPYNWFCAVLSL